MYCSQEARAATAPPAKPAHIIMLPCSRLIQPRYSRVQQYDVGPDQCDLCCFVTYATRTRQGTGCVLEQGNFHVALIASKGSGRALVPGPRQPRGWHINMNIKRLGAAGTP